MPPLSSTFKATYCNTFGFGRCLCSGPGFRLDVARRNLSNTLCKLAPKDSQLRRLLSDGYLVFDFDGELYHIAICQYRPKTPIFCRVVLQSDLWCGRRRIEPAFTANAHHDIMLDFAVLDKMDLLLVMSD